MSKGSRQRPINDFKAFADHWDRIFKNKGNTREGTPAKEKERQHREQKSPSN